MIKVVLIPVLLIYFSHTKYNANKVVHPLLNPGQSIPLKKIEEYKIDGQFYPSWIFDQRGYLPPSSFRELNKTITDVNKNTPFDILLIIVDTIDETDSGFNYTKKILHSLFQEKPSKNKKGVLISLIIEDKKGYILTEEGARKTLTKKALDNIRIKMGPDMAREAYADGIRLAVDSLAKLIYDSQKLLARLNNYYFKHPSIILSLGAGALVVFGLIIFGLIKLMVGKSKKSKKMEEKKNDDKKSKQNDVRDKKKAKKTSAKKKTQPEGIKKGDGNSESIEKQEEKSN